MDKRKNGQTITIKINGKDRPFKEDPSENQIEARENEPKKVPNEYSENHDLYTRQAAAAEESIEESFDWILPEPAGQPEVKKDNKTGKQNKPKGKSLGDLIKKNNHSRQGVFSSIFFAVFLAVLLGVSFGFILLKLVITDYAVEKSGETAAANQENQPSSGTASLTIPPISAFIVQGGVYKTNESAEQVKASVEEKGVSAQIVNMNGMFVILLSVADSIENAKEIGSQLKENGIEIFAKPVDFGGKELGSLQDPDKKLLESAPALYQALAAAASEASLSNSISPAAIENINKQAEGLKQIEEAKIKNENAKMIRTNLTSAIEKANSFQQSPGKAELKDLQQSLIAFLATYQNM